MAIVPLTLPIGPMTPSWLSDTSVDQSLKDQWISDGVCVIRGVYQPEEIATYTKAVETERALLDDGKDEYGLGDRIGQLHQKHPDLLRLASDKRVISFLRWAFNDEPVVFGSLNFERGSTQEAHIDAIFFWPEPSFSMAGCWVALEEVAPEAGPLFYIPNSHTWPFYRSEDVVATRPELASERKDARRLDFPENRRGELLSRLGSAWSDDFLKLESSKQAKRITLPLKAGDVVFWHSLLAHGGAPRVNPRLSRRSVVYHFIGKHTKLFTFEQFMLYNRDEIPSLPAQPLDLGSYGDLQYMRYPYYVTWNKGAQIVHKLS